MILPIGAHIPNETRNLLPLPSSVPLSRTPLPLSPTRSVLQDLLPFIEPRRPSPHARPLPCYTSKQNIPWENCHRDATPGSSTWVSDAQFTRRAAPLFASCRVSTTRIYAPSARTSTQAPCYSLLRFRDLCVYSRRSVSVYYADPVWFPLIFHTAGYLHVARYPVSSRRGSIPCVIWTSAYALILIASLIRPARWTAARSEGALNPPSMDTCDKSRMRS